MNLRSVGITNRLLIEPVWNRNKKDRYGSIRQCLAFNRTSMESKREFGVRLSTLPRAF